MWRRFTPTVKDLFMLTHVLSNHTLCYHCTTWLRISESPTLSFIIGPQNKLVPIQTSRKKWGNARYADINANRILNFITELKTIFKNWSVYGSVAWSSLDPLNVSGILVWYKNPIFCLEYHGDMKVEQAQRESQETRWTLANVRILSYMTYVGIGIHPMTGKNQRSEYCLVFHFA